jgi:DNA repair exonuclease SbcCD ATPase subunit
MSHQNNTREPARAGHVRTPAGVLDAHAAPAHHGDDELSLLRSDNAALQARVEELEQLLIRTEQQGEERWAERQREYEGLLEEKSEVIRGLHQKLGELRERVASAPAEPAPVDDGGPVPDRQELLRLQRELEEQRQQMQDDEEGMMTQLRQMEMALAKDRAELARQRNELQRLHDELKHEIETASRDSGLRERLGALQRRTSAPPRPGPNQDTPPPGVLSKPTPTSAQPTKSGLFRRIFGSGQ